MKKIRKPQLRKPQLRTPKFRTPRIQAPRIQAPQFLNHLYRDLRDRRLLFPAVALLVALVAVPVAFSSSSAPTPPPPAPTASGTEPAPATEPAVLAEELGVTNYQKRLERLQSKNPFKQQYVEAPSGAQPETSSSADTSASTAGSSLATEPSSTTSTAPDPTTTSSPASTTPPEPSQPVLFVFQADLAIGRPGDLTRKSVELGKFLPSQAKPMVAFAGATGDMKHALFLVSAGVSSVETDGRCVPGPNTCRLLKLKIGDEAKLAYAPEADRHYKLRLHGIELAPADAKAAGKRGKRDTRDPLFALAAQG